MNPAEMLPGAGRAPSKVATRGCVGMARASRPPSRGRQAGLVGMVRASLPGAWRTVGRLPPSRTNFAKAAELGPPGELKGARFLTCYKSAVGTAELGLRGQLKGAGFLTCYNSASSPSVDDSSLHQKLDLILEQINQVHQKMDMRAIFWKILGNVLSFVSVLLITTLLYMAGRNYVEAELNKIAKAIFFSFVNDAKVKQNLQELIQEGIDTTFYHISSLNTWYRWLRGRRGGTFR